MVSPGGVVPRGIELCNPGNLEISSNPWIGKVTPSRDPRFETFDTMGNGIRAIARNFITHQKEKVRVVCGQVAYTTTICGLILVQAPPGENDTPGYVQFVARHCQAVASEPYDLQNLDNLQRFLAAVFAMEQDHYPVDPTLIRMNAARALGMPAAAPAPPIAARA
jgi:hypothetical protein